MKIDTNAFINSLPIMGIGLLGIFIVTAVIILGIYILKAVTTHADSIESSESPMDLMKEREKKDFLETDDDLYISKDL